MDQLNGCGAQTKDLNRVIQRHHYPMPTIEDIATSLHGTTKCLLLLMLRMGFGMLC